MESSTDCRGFTADDLDVKIFRNKETAQKKLEYFKSNSTIIKIDTNDFTQTFTQTLQ